MYIASLHLHNFGRFADLEIPLWPEDGDGPRVTVLIGENGSGKSTVVDGVTTLLSWLVARIRSDRGSGSPIDELRIRNGASAAEITLSLVHERQRYEWSLARPHRGRKRIAESSLKAATERADLLRQRLTDNDGAPLPLVAYYPTERYVLDIPKRIRTRHRFQQVDGYDASLSQGIDFRRFFEWFREREDIRNEGVTHFVDLLPYLDMKKFGQCVDLNGCVPWEKLSELLDTEKIRREKPSFESLIAALRHIDDPQYLAVLEAIAAFMPGYDNLRIQRRPRMRMVINKGEEELDILQLSQGERSLLALVGDIARRLAMMNPQAEKPLHGKGIVLIDEVDLHLHPRWQRTVIRRLRETFPNCHFILTTHSPLVISDPQHIRVLLLQNGEVREPGNLYGMDLEELLLGVMDTDIRDPELQKRLDSLLDAIQQWDYEKADGLRRELLQDLPPDHRELLRADMFLRRQKALDAKNHQG